MSDLRPAAVPRVAFTAYGIPQSAGSKSAHVLTGKDGQPLRSKKTGRMIVNVTDSNPKGKGWRAVVVAACRDVYRGPLLEGPLSLRVAFRFPRPGGHYGARGLRASAPQYPAVKPDTTKLMRALEDALTGILWRDDVQVVEQLAVKVYGEPAGASVIVEPAPPGLGIVSGPLNMPLFGEGLA